MEIPSKEVLLKLYRDLLTARRLETRIAEVRAELGMAGAHRGPGEEAIPIAICNNLTKTDCFHPNFRTHFCLFTKPGFTLADVVADEIGRVARLAPGHYSPWFTPEFGTLGSSGTVGEPSVKYVGAALADSIKKTGNITVFVQGDGASNRAPTHEAMVVASCWHLPMVFVIQNNRYGMGTAMQKCYTIDDLSLRGVGYGMPHERVDGNDMIAMYLVAKRHIEMARAGAGPSLIAADTYRLRAHYEGDAESYRPRGEKEEWQRKYDPLPRYQKQLSDLGILSEANVAELEKEIATELDAAVAEAMAFPVRSYDMLEKSAIAEL